MKMVRGMILIPERKGNFRIRRNMSDCNGKIRIVMIIFLTEEELAQHQQLIPMSLMTRIGCASEISYQEYCWQIVK
jgi:hypothetical protein